MLEFQTFNQTPLELTKSTSSSVPDGHIYFLTLFLEKAAPMADVQLLLWLRSELSAQEKRNTMFLGAVARVTSSPQKARSQ